MALRPARTCRSPRGQPWARVSQKTPRKSFVKGAPNPCVRQYNMGVDRRYEVEATLVALESIQVRDNALEAARQAANKFLEKHLAGNYFLQLVAYPHLVHREHSALGVAGADRISKGMKLAFGRPKGRLARLGEGDVVFVARVMEKDLPLLKQAFSRAEKKMSGKYFLKTRDIRRDPVNLARREHVFKAVEEVVEEKVVEKEKEAEEVKEEKRKEVEKEKEEKEAVKEERKAFGEESKDKK